jgi:hypothetical protein
MVSASTWFPSLRIAAATGCRGSARRKLSLEMQLREQLIARLRLAFHHPNFSIGI